ncbi:armadillo repeat-containing protein 5 [Microdochium nivale]|nr:armadillo repeat-containing protein 5 [Microdochium nivale]
MASDSGPPPSASLTPEPRLESAASPVKKLDTSREPTPKPELEYILDPRGDLWLHTRGKDASGLSQAARLRVCSRTLARTSPVFNKMLYGRFAEARDNNQDPDQEWVIELPDDLTSPMRTLLEIMHGDFSRMKRVVGPHKSTIRALYDLIVVADKYDCVALLRPWGASWALCQKIETMTNHDLFRMAWVYYQLGYQLGYEEVVTRLILDFAPSTQGEVDEIPVLPASLYDKVVDLRQDLMASLLGPLVASIDQLVSGATQSVGLCIVATDSTHRLACESSMLGKLMRRLHQQKFWPIPDSSDITLTLNRVDQFMTELATAPTDESGYYDISIGTNHSCVVIGPPHLTREAALDEPGTYSKDYRYKADEAESAHMEHQAQISAIMLHSPQALLDEDNILFPL